MASNHRRLIRKLTVNVEKYSRTRQQSEYLNGCLEQKILPRSLNFIKKAKSEVLWDTNLNEEIYETLFNASIKVVNLQFIAKTEKYEEFDKQASILKKRLREEVTEEVFEFEMSKLKRHMARICADGNLRKERKLIRDAEETQKMKELIKSKTPTPKKKCRRFNRKDVQTEDNDNNMSQIAQDVVRHLDQEGNTDVHTEIHNDNISHLTQDVGRHLEQEGDSEVHTENHNNNMSQTAQGVVGHVVQEGNSDVHFSPIHGKVKNLSSVELTEAQESILELGPKFCPVEHDINRARYQKDLNEGFRRMKLKAKFYPGEDSRSEEEKRFYVKSDWEPPSPNYAVRTFEMLLQNEFDVWKQPTRVARNLSFMQLQALKELKANDDIDVKLDDKGGGFVVADKPDYISSVNNDLNNQRNIVSIDPQTDRENIVRNVNEEIETIVNRMIRSGEISESTGKYITHKTAGLKLARYYCNWKCHKYAPTQTEFSAAAVRGIVSCSGTPDERLCDFLDYLLNPGMQKLRSYLKGTKDFLQWVEKLKTQYPELPPLFGMLTIDYKAMYPSMPDDLVLPAVRDYLESRNTNKPSTAQTMELLEITRKYNYFEFGQDLFKQEGGTSIGKKHAPDTACLGAGKLEEDKIFPSNIFKEIMMNDEASEDEKNRHYKRFIDDMMGFTNCTGVQAAQFVEWLNTLHPNLGFTFEFSHEKITFLDVTLLVENGQLVTDRHIKPTNPQLFLHFTSNHPKSVFKAIVYGQGLTVRMICSKDNFVEKHLSDLRKKFIDRGYPVEMVDLELARGSSIPREDLLTVRPIYPVQASPVPPIGKKRNFFPTFIVTYNPHNPPLKKWVQDFHFILLAHPKLAKIYPKDSPPAVTYRQPRNLKQILVRSSLRELPYRSTEDLEDLPPPGCFKHNHGRRGRKCELCQRLLQGDKFSSQFTGFTYRIRRHLTCKSRYIVYLATCLVDSCGKQYCGSSTQYMHVRHGGHRQEILNGSTAVGRHFATCGLENMQIQIIDSVKEGQQMALLNLEGYWQNILATFVENGNINVRDELRELGQQPNFF